MSDLTGKVVLVTGASRGIGAAAARAFADAGAIVGLIARSKDEIATLAGELGADRALAITCDITRFWEVSAAVDAMIQSFGRLDVLVNNAGVIEPISPLDETDPEAWGQLIDINLKGAFHGIRAAAPVMKRQGAGTIITISSGAASRPIEGWSAYCASKAGAKMLTEAADLELRGQGLRVMGLSPGTVATDMQKVIKSSDVDNRVRQLEWDDHIPPEWPARALVWMAGPAGDDLCGQEVSLRDEDVRRAVGLVD
ncbi:NADP-dependent 3-hydroxy acid dehydrogenase YdfG [Palleronia marisminoris]|uniref:Putative oxidoreductase n=1 Tax=Palleronia marisminoris TaxID=315423 RepID=A0A1Y5SHQ7_9RHOB|nr:SDR family oxidoreductase [Palleronia marisminoris]SFG83385.1 NADP-dependent 3-hydroxy acid dehydrogenase YdfG [Palleronia marisminoris]SLN40969.1 putative oxidoreductase [Palleronia marisminoris]